MSSALGIVVIVMLLFVVAIATKRTVERDDRKRSVELKKIANELWVAETDLDTLAFFYDFTVRQMYRLKHEDKPYDHLVKDVNLILEIRNEIIDNDVIREVDGLDGDAPGRIHHDTPPNPARTPRSPGDVRRPDGAIGRKNLDGARKFLRPLV